MALLVIPIFISHQGCPHRCIFCDQYTITGHSEMAGQPVTPASVRKTIEQWLKRPRKENNGGVQVAFYGGSFTGLSLQRQRGLLRAVTPYIEDGLVDAIRVSTRPDYIDDTTLFLLKEHSVGIVELGIQSLHQDVLAASLRGHSVQQSEEAICLLKKNGFTVGAQIMCGLPGDSTSRLIATVKRVAALTPDFVRIYPVLVIRGSGLEKMYRNKAYKPLSLSKAIALGCRMKSLFDQHGIKVVRMGLQPSRELEDKVLAGPYHPSFGELVISRTLFEKSRKVLRRTNTTPQRWLSIAAADESAFRGHNNVSIKRLAALGLLDGVELVFDRDQPRNQVDIFSKNGEKPL
jgi:histone acetyltransferase (RNA polymerase elongator complex component)